MYTEHLMAAQTGHRYFRSQTAGLTQFGFPSFQIPMHFYRATLLAADGPYSNHQTAGLTGTLRECIFRNPAARAAGLTQLIFTAIMRGSAQIIPGYIIQQTPG